MAEFPAYAGISVWNGYELRRSDQTGVEITRFNFCRSRYLPSPFWPVTSPSLTTVLPRTMVSLQKRQHVFDVIGKGGCGGVLGALACDDFQAQFGQGW